MTDTLNKSISAKVLNEYLVNEDEEGLLIHEQEASEEFVVSKYSYCYIYTQSEREYYSRGITPSYLNKLFVVDFMF